MRIISLSGHRRGIQSPRIRGEWYCFLGNRRRGRTAAVIHYLSRLALILILREERKIWLRTGSLLFARRSDGTGAERVAFVPWASGSIAFSAGRKRCSRCMGID